MTTPDDVVQGDGARVLNAFPEEEKDSGKANGLDLTRQTMGFLPSLT
jgi:hypothetical protein